MMSKNLPLISSLFCRRFELHKSCASLTCFPRRFSAKSAAPSKPSYIHHIGKHPLVYRTIGEELQRAVSDFGSTEAIVSCHEQKRHTFNELLELVDRLAAGLSKLGLQRGDHVGIWGPNSLSWYLTMLACARAGLVSVGINPALQGPEVEYCLRAVNVKAIVAPERYKSQNYYEILLSICPELATSDPGDLVNMKLPHLRTVIIDSESRLKGALCFDQVMDLGSREEVRAVETMLKNVNPDWPCNVQFTSGTTGRPKATVLSHFNFVNNGIHVGSRNQYAGERLCVQVPLFHAYGVIIAIMAAMSHGATLVLPSAGFNAEASLQAIVNEKCTVIHGTPTMYVDLIKKQRELKMPLKSAKTAVTGGAPCSPALFLDIKKELDLEDVRTVYGLTEGTAVMFQTRPGDTEEQILNTVGHIQDHIEAKVVDGMGNTVPFGQRGELWVRGYLTMLRYHGERQMTKQVIDEDKWLRTGDQFILQEDGYGRIVGRLKEMILRGGENIFPKEIEDFLNSHPDIIEAHVIGVPDDRLGEEIAAFVRLRDGVKNISREELKEFCKGKIAHFKVPRYVLPVDEFPKTTSGKVQKFKLEDIFEKLEDQQMLED